MINVNLSILYTMEVVQTDNLFSLCGWYCHFRFAHWFFNNFTVLKIQLSRSLKISVVSFIFTVKQNDFIFLLWFKHFLSTNQRKKGERSFIFCNLHHTSTCTSCYKCETSLYTKDGLLLACSNEHLLSLHTPLTCLVLNSFLALCFHNLKTVELILVLSS